MTSFRGIATAVLVGVLAVSATAMAPADARAAGASASGVPGANRLVGIAPATALGFSEYVSMYNGKVPALRVPIFWQDVQPTPTSFSFDSTDRAVAYAAAAGMRVRPFVMGVPDWVQQASHGDEYPPVNSSYFRRAWKQLLVTLIKRYGPRGLLWRYLAATSPYIEAQPIRTWQIWNEPNARTYWRPASTAPQNYAKLLKASASTIRAHDHGAQVIAAGLFMQPLDGVSMPQFANALYQVPGAAASFDAFAIHPYARNVAGVLKQIRIARHLMKGNGDAGKKLWITELGWPTKRAYGRGLFVKTEGGQMRLLARTFKTILHERRQWRIGALIWYTWRDNNLFTTCDLCRFSGLFREDLSPKPSWSAFTAVTGGSAQTPMRAGEVRRPPLPVPAGFG